MSGDGRIEMPEYQGPERRATVHCPCHVKHVKQLTDHEEDIKKMEDESKKDHKIMAHPVRINNDAGTKYYIGLFFVPRTQKSYQR